MKGLLLGSTALITSVATAASALAADPIEISMAGYYTFYAMAGAIGTTYATNGNFTSYRGTAFMQEGELHSSARRSWITAPQSASSSSSRRGTPVGAFRSKFPDRRSVHLWFGDWGRVELGSRDAASYRMYYGTPSALIGWGAIQHNHNWDSTRHGQQQGWL